MNVMNEIGKKFSHGYAGYCKNAEDQSCVAASFGSWVLGNRNYTRKDSYVLTPEAFGIRVR